MLIIWNLKYIASSNHIKVDKLTPKGQKVDTPEVLWFTRTIQQEKQESIPVGCQPSACKRDHGGRGLDWGVIVQ